MLTWEQLLVELERPFYGNTLREWAIAIGAAIALFLFLKLMQALLVSRLRKLTEKYPTDTGVLVVEALASVRLWFLLIIAIFVGSLLLALPPKTTSILNTIAIVAVLLQAAIMGHAVITRIVSGYSQRNLSSDAASVTTVTTLGFLGQLALWTIVVLLMLQNLGINVTALVTGLGIGGVAVALAAQNILGDLLASLSIMFDKPFVLGDFIIVGDQMGTVEKIGIKTTHLRSLSGEQLIMPNNDLVKSRIRNFKRMQERRFAFTIGVTYQTPPEKLATIPGMLREAIEQQSNIRFDRAHFRGFTPTSLEFEIVYFVLSPDYNQYMDIQQAINLNLYERFAAAGLRFAQPTLPVTVQAAEPASKAEQVDEKKPS